MINQLYELYLRNRQISTDTRSLLRGDIFFALKGGQYDASRFIDLAFEKGASFCVTDNVAYKERENCLYVEDVLCCLQDLARYHRTQLQIPLIGITGTNGKTTTKELTSRVLSMKYRCFSTKGNLNNQIGVPLSILSIPADTQIALIEMGANHIGEIDFLCKIAQPTFGIVTNIGRAHLEGFGSIEGVIQTKTELYRYIQKQGGTLFVNADDTLLISHLGEVSSISYGTSPQAHYRAVYKGASPYLSFYFEEIDRVYPVSTKLFGYYNFENAMAAVCIGRYFGVDCFEIKEALETYESINNRSQYLKTERNELFLDAYNANPSSMRVAIANFFQLATAYKKVLVLGGMKELGALSEQEHRELLRFVLQKNFSEVFLVGEEFVFAKQISGISWFASCETYQEWLRENPIEKASILIKGSRSNQLESIVAFL